MDEQTKDQIRDLVARAKLDKALEMFSDWAELHGDKELKNALFMKTGEYTGLRKNENLGMIGSSEAGIQRNRIAGAILAMLDDAQVAVVVIKPNTPEKKTVVEVEHAKAGSTEFSASSSHGTILFLAANPSNTGKLQLDKEFVEVFQNLGEKKVTYTLKAEFAVTASSLQSALLKYEPRIVHFSGHGDGGDGNVPTNDESTRAIGRILAKGAGIILQKSDGSSQLVSGVALANLFSVCLEIFKLEVVILNACSSKEQALAIFDAGVPYVIGMNAAVKDKSAIQFSAKFYEGLASKGNVELAFKLARAGVMLENEFANDADIPVLYKKPV